MVHQRHMKNKVKAQTTKPEIYFLLGDSERGNSTRVGKYMCYASVPRDFLFAMYCLYFQNFHSTLHLYNTRSK